MIGLIPEKCPLWITTDAEVQETGHSLIVHSERAGGTYVVLRHVGIMLFNGYINHFSEPRLVDEIRARITTWLVKQRRQGNESPELTQDVIDRACKGELQSMMLRDKADRLLEYIASEHRKATPFSLHKVTGDGFRAFCEAENQSEVEMLLDYLKKKGCLEPAGLSGNARISVEGYERVALLAQTNQYSKQIFVAMWFDNSINRLYDEVIKSTIEETGYVPYRVDRPPKEDKDAYEMKICDRVEVEVRRSRMLVADFTHGESGARGGVYYEAGLARGIGIPVIWTCREDMLKDKLHFDTRQYPHIGWKWDELPQFKQQLMDRIEILANAT